MLTDHIKHQLVDILSPQQLSALLLSTDAIETFSPTQIIGTQKAYGSGFNLQSRLMLFLSTAAFLTSLATFKRHPQNMSDGQAPDHSTRLKMSISRPTPLPHLRKSILKLTSIDLSDVENFESIGTPSLSPTSVEGRDMTMMLEMV